MQSMENLQKVSVGGTNMSNVGYAEDLAVIANSEVKLQLLMTNLKEAWDTYGMEVKKINTKKIKLEYTVVAKDPEGYSIQLIDIVINQADTFTYLATLKTNDGRCIIEIKCRRAQSKTAFSNLKNNRTSSKKPIRMRFRVLCFYLWPILLYAWEIWTLHCQTRKLLEENLELWYLRRMERILYAAQIVNEIYRANHQKLDCLKNHWE